MTYNDIEDGCFKDSRSPFAAEWDGFTSDGQPCQRVLYVEDLLIYVAKGYSPQEISVALNAPMEAIEHLLCHIPYMMGWRKEEKEKQLDTYGAQKLPDYKELLGE